MPLYKIICLLYILDLKKNLLSFNLEIERDWSQNQTSLQKLGTTGTGRIKTY